MYNSLIWAGTNLPLPQVVNGLPAPSEEWKPIFGAAEHVPGFWWLLLDRSNFFWRPTGSPIFIVQKVKALARADTRFAMLSDVMEIHQHQAWYEFRQCLGSSPGELFIIELSGLWEFKYGSDNKSFEAYLDSCFLLIGTSNSTWRKLHIEQKRIIFAEFFADAKFDLFGSPVMVLAD